MGWGVIGTMSDIVIIAGINGIISVITAIIALIGIVLTKKIHVLVNSKMTKALETIDKLRIELIEEKRVVIDKVIENQALKKEVEDTKSKVDDNVK